MSEICASCVEFDMHKIVKSNPGLHPNWLSERNYVQEFISKVTKFSNKYPTKFNTKMKVDVGKKHSGKKILYWASKEKTNQLSVNDAKTAYGTFVNSGVVNVDKNGCALLKFQCPQIYKTTPKNHQKSKTYYRHLHFVISNSEKTEWTPQIYTKIVVCKLDLKKSMKMLHSGNFVFINALPCEYYAKDHIPNSYNISLSMAKSMSAAKLAEWMNQVVQLHYPHINRAIKDKKINVQEIPIVVYCAHEKCNASELVLEELMKKGMVNINEFSGGMKAYRNFV